MEDIRRMEDETQRELEAVGIFKPMRQGGHSPDVAGSLLGGSRGPLTHRKALESQREKWGAILPWRITEKGPLPQVNCSALPCPPFLRGRRGSLETLVSSRIFLSSCFS